MADTFDTLSPMTDYPEDVDGLVDARRLADWLGVPVSRVHTWTAKKQKSKKKTETKNNKNKLTRKTRKGKPTQQKQD